MNNIGRPEVVTPQEWEIARVHLLAQEQGLTRARDAVAAQRRRMPWQKVDRKYLDRAHHD